MLTSLTTSILLYPVDLALESHPVQSLHLFPDLPLFALIFVAWTLLLALLAFSKGAHRDEWEKLALVCVSSLVFLAFWSIVTPYGRLDYASNAAHVKFLQESGRIPLGHPNLTYFDFPGTSLLGLIFSEIIPLGTFQAINLYLVMNALVFASLTYAIFLRSLGNARGAALATLLLIQGDMYLARAWAFYPGFVALPLLLVFLLLASRGGRTLWETRADRLCVLTVLGAATAMHFATSLSFFFVLLGAYLVTKRAGKSLVRAASFGVFLVIPIAWEVYWATTTFEMLSGFGSKVVEDLSQEGFVNLSWVFFLGEGNFGENLPIWVRGVRLFWMALIFGVGSVLAIRNLFRARQLSLAQKMETGGVLAFLLLTLTASLLSGGERVYYFLHFAPFFTVPILVRSFLNLRGKLKHAFTLLALCFVVLSFPTFLSHNTKIGTDAYYSYEYSAGEFLGDNSKGEGLTVLNPVEPMVYYVPDATLLSNLNFRIGMNMEEDEFWHLTHDAVQSFARSASQGDSSTVFVTSNRLKVLAELLFRISPTDPRWSYLECGVGQENRIYENGYVQIYAP